MAARRYQNFDLALEGVGPGLYRARVVQCPVGEYPSVAFSLPFGESELELLMLKLDPGRSGTRRSGFDSQRQACLDLGGGLFDCVFREEVMLAWSRSRDVTRAAGEGLRLRLRFIEAPDVAGLPWELLYDRRTNSFVAQSDRTPLVRYLEVPYPPRPLTVDGALRILVVLSSPTDLPELDVDGEWRRVHEAMTAKTGTANVIIDRLPSPTMAELSVWLEHHDVHVLHFVGHGDYDERTQSGVVYFCDRYGRGVAVGADTLGPFLHDHDPLRLVLLNACRSARVDAVDPFGGMAQGLVQQDVTAVVAMQFPISDTAAVAFTSSFYGAVSGGIPLDQAATWARKALLVSHPGEWATPVLFLRAPDGRVFDDIAAAQPLGCDSVSVLEPETLSLAADRPARGLDDTPGGWVPADRRLRRMPMGRLRLSIGFVVAVLLAAGGLVWYRLSTSGQNDGGRAPSAIRTGTAEPGVPSVTTLRGPTVTALRLTTGLNIDGDTGDWPADAPTFDSNVLVAGDIPTVKATWTMGWDLDNLSVLVEVTDPTRTQTHADDVSQLWNGDGVSFEFGTPIPKNGNAALESDDLQVMVGPAFDDPNNLGRFIAGLNIAIGADFTRGASTIQGLKAAVNQQDNGYNIEARIPWSTLHISNPRVGTQFGINLNVSDAIPDGTRRGNLLDLVSNNRDRRTNDASTRDRWGTLTLSS